MTLPSTQDRPYGISGRAMLWFGILSVPVAMVGFMLPPVLSGGIAGLGGVSPPMDLGAACLLVACLGLVLRVWHPYWAYNAVPLMICLMAPIFALLPLFGLFALALSVWGDD